MCDFSCFFIFDNGIGTANKYPIVYVIVCCKLMKYPHCDSCLFFKIFDITKSSIVMWINVVFNASVFFHVI